MITFNKNFIDMRLFDDNPELSEALPRKKGPRSLLGFLDRDLPLKIPLTDDIKLASWVPSEDIDTIKSSKEIPKITALFYGREDSYPHYKCINKIVAHAAKAFDDGLYDINTLTRTGPNVEHAIRVGLFTSSEIFSFYPTSVLEIFSTLHWRDVYKSNASTVKSNSAKILRTIKQLEKHTDTLFELLGEKGLEFAALDLLPLFNVLNETVEAQSHKQRVAMRPFSFYANGYKYHLTAHEIMSDFYLRAKELAFDEQKALKINGKAPSRRVYIIRRVTFELLSAFSCGGVEFALHCIKGANFHSLVSHIAGLLLYETPLELANARAEIDTAISIWRKDSFASYPVD